MASSYQQWLNRQHKDGKCEDCNKYGRLALADACPASLDTMTTPPCCEKYICINHDCIFQCKSCNQPVDNYKRHTDLEGYIYPKTCSKCKTILDLCKWYGRSPNLERQLLKNRGF